MATWTRTHDTFRLPRAAILGLALLAALALVAAGCRPSPPPPKHKPAGTTPGGPIPPVAGVAQGNQGEIDTWDDLTELVRRFVSQMDDPAVASWEEQASIAIFGNTLVVTQNAVGLKKVDDLMRALNEKSELKIEKTVALGDVPGDQALAHTRELLAGKIDMDLPDGTTVSQFAELLNKCVPGLNVVVADIHGGPSDPAVKVKGKREDTAEQILKDAIPGEMAYTVSPGCVLIVPKETQSLGVALYRLAAKPETLTQGELLDFDELREVVAKTVSNMSCPKVAAWADEGGPACLEYFPRNILVVTQTEEGHRRLAALLDSLVRVGGLKSVTQLAVTDPDEPPESAKVRAALREMMDISVKEMSLDKVLVLISQHGPSLYLDPDIAAGGIDLSTRLVNLDLKQVPVGTLLDIVLGADLGCKIQSGCVMITTRDKLQQNLPIVLYKVKPVTPR